MFNYRDVLDSDGLIARGRSHYERRAAQLAMAAEVDAAIRERRCLAVEAGTGVGKSFAYLVPAILYVVEDQVRDFSKDRGRFYPSFDELVEKFSPKDVLKDETARESLVDEPSMRSSSTSYDSVDDNPLDLRRVIVSTHTISLQEQLFDKDIPFLNSILPFEFTAALAKGRSNYVCRRRYAQAKKSVANGSLLETDAQVEFARLDDWLQKTTDGSKSDISPTPSFDVWNEICCEQGNCLGRKCERYDSCFYYRARRRLERAQIIVVNHALLFSDLAIRQGGYGILPNYDVLVFDEAHTMEQVAAEHMGSELTRLAVDRLLTRLYNDRTNKGLLVEETSKIEVPGIRQAFIDAKKIVDDCRDRAGVFFEELADWLDDRPGSSGRVLETNIVRNGIGEGLKLLSAQLRRVSEFIEDPGRRQEYVSTRAKVDAFISAIDDWLQQNDEGFVYWLEKTLGRGKPRITMCSAPIDVAPILREKLFNAIPTVVAASATLTTTSRRVGESTGLRNKSDEDAEPEEISVDATAAEPDDESEETKKAFEFFRSRVGMTGARARALGSPFDYRRQMTLVLAKGLELNELDARVQSLASAERDRYNERRLFAALQEYVEETQGGAFVLFTNASQMKRATETFTSWTAKKNYPFFSQTDGTPRRRMVQMFKESANGVLFGVDSFWQGVDVPGAALRNVIIVKLPFLSPGQPLVEARQELIQERGGNPFKDYLLPTAILKFKQGVGRLIRTKDDEGQVVVLDERVHTKSYGRSFLRALPDCKLRVDLFD